MGTLDDFQKLLKDGFLNPDSTHNFPNPTAHAHGLDPNIHIHPENVRKGSVAKSLLRGSRPAEKRVREVLDYDPSRPLIDIVQQGSVMDWPGLYEVADHRAFQQTLRKAKCFTLDAETSSLMAEFSIAIASNLDTVRQMAIPPFPVTWIEFDNVARITTMERMGVPLTPQAANETGDKIVSRVGWLIQPGEGGYHMTYFTLVDQGPIMAPLSWWWTVANTNEPLPKTAVDLTDSKLFIERLAFGIRDTGVPHTTFTVRHGPNHRLYGMSPGDLFRNTGKVDILKHHFNLTEELAGELRHVWALLLTMAAGHAGLTASTSPKARPSSPDPIQPNGKPLLPLEHRHLHLHLGKRYTPQRVVLQAVTHHRKRHHEVRAHLRRLRSGRFVPVKAHDRGDRALGSITKDYIVEK